MNGRKERSVLHEQANAYDTVGPNGDSTVTVVSTYEPSERYSSSQRVHLSRDAAYSLLFDLEEILRRDA